MSHCLRLHCRGTAQGQDRDPGDGDSLRRERPRGSWRARSATPASDGHTGADGARPKAAASEARSAVGAGGGSRVRAVQHRGHQPRVSTEHLNRDRQRDRGTEPQTSRHFNWFNLNRDGPVRRGPPPGEPRLQRAFMATREVVAASSSSWKGAGSRVSPVRGGGLPTPPAPVFLTRSRAHVGGPAPHPFPPTNTPF